ncbi:MAG TPA: hypothetical protein VF642_01005 [Propionibacteriaceae bacterium]|jgi:hypothetical protein
MDILVKALDSLWQVLAVGLLLGAGLPALFALGLRSLNTGRTVTVGTGSLGAGTGGGSSVHGGLGADTSKPSALGLAGAVVCFGIVVLAVVFGIVVIIFGKQLFG